MMQIPPEFILGTLKNAYIKYNSIRDTEQGLKVYGFCDGLEKLVFKFAPEYTQEIQQMKKKYNISPKKSNSDDINLDEPTWTRQYRD